MDYIIGNAKCNSQASLSKDGQEKIDDVGGQPHEHDGTERVIELVRGHVAIRIPESHLERIFHAQITSHIHDPLPGALLVLLHSYVIDGYLKGPKMISDK